VVEAGAQCHGGPRGGSWGSHRMSWSNSDPAGRRERERLGTPDRSPSTDPRTHMHRREGPPWLPLGRLEREGSGGENERVRNFI
jgi:hypothetical protein